MKREPPSLFRKFLIGNALVAGLPLFVLLVVFVLAGPELNRNWAVWCVVATIGVSALLSAFFSNRISRQLSDYLALMEHGAKRFAMGDSSNPLSLPEIRELSDLARALNRVGARVRDKFEELLEQRNEREAVLSSMTESVIALDLEENIIAANKGAIKLFGVSATAIIGLSIQEALRSVGCERVVQEVLATGEEIKRDTRDELRELLLQVHGTPLLGAENDLRGAVLVINDVTQIRKLENVRKDFVANVSHELKTPLTTIRGFVETLLDGALQKPADAERFLKIIDAQVKRMHHIVEDLLMLATLDQGSASVRSAFVKVDLREVVSRVSADVREQWKEREIRVVNDVPPVSLVKGIDSLIYQAVYNLIENGVKYSEPASTVNVSLSRDSSELGPQLKLSIKDQGPGIAKHHHSRLFERFYRVDEGRARKAGGTGLGLAIVKHIAQVHGGEVKLESTIGEGSCFQLTLPEFIPQEMSQRNVPQSNIAEISGECNELQ